MNSLPPIDPPPLTVDQAWERLEACMKALLRASEEANEAAADVLAAMAVEKGKT